MKKIYLMGLTAAFAMSVNAQTSIKLKTTNRGELKNASAAKGGITASPNQIVGAIVCNTQYIAGSTMDLGFSISLTNTDSEFGDLVTITFPTGITPNTSPNNTDPIGPGDGTGAPEALNPIAGQVVSWGDNDNSYGGVPTGVTYNFTVNVTIGAGVTGNQNAAYDISGDTYGAAPGDLVGGSMTIYPAGATIVDLKTKFVVPTGITAINNCGIGSSPIAARFVNLSSTPQANFAVNYSVNGAASTQSIIAGPLAVGDSVDVIFATPYNFNASTIYNIKGWVTQTSDAFPTNDTAALTVVNSNPVALTNTLTPYINGIENPYDFASIVKDWIGSGAPFGQSTATVHTGTVALFYTLSGANPSGTYETFAVLPCTDVTSGEVYKISYWKKANTSGTLTVNGQSAIMTGTAQTAADMTGIVKAYSAITPNAQTGVWAKDSAYYTATANETRYFAIGAKGVLAGASTQINVRVDDIMISKVGTVGVKTNTANDAISIFPNPTSGILNINAVEANSSVEVFNVIGDKVYTSSLVKGNNTIDLSSLSNGAYFVKLSSNNQITTKKVVLSK